ncbi:hypothetical protein SXCC_04157 [Gluconacetobacter sp. SXCC-1]|nr:hypothetical protein SXCC_04157 [Gluconacetobacter sp. SXCC-1]
MNGEHTFLRVGFRHSVIASQSTRHIRSRPYGARPPCAPAHAPCPLIQPVPQRHPPRTGQADGRAPDTTHNPARTGRINDDAGVIHTS